MNMHIKEAEDLLLKEAQTEYLAEDAQFGQHTDVVKKMRSFLAMAGENKDKNTRELFREHIPASVFGIASDEVASDLGITENELMARLTSGLKVRSSSGIKATINKVTRTILTEVERRKIRESKRIEVIKIKFGCIFYSELRKLIYARI